MKQPTTPLRFACARGLSLIETMVAVAILGSMVAMAAPSFARIGERYRVSGVQSDLEATLHAARVEAVNGESLQVESGRQLYLISTDVGKGSGGGTGGTGSGGGSNSPDPLNPRQIELWLMKLERQAATPRTVDWRILP